MNRSPRSNIRRLAIGRLISVTGGAAAYTALMFTVWNRTHSAAWQSGTLLLTFGVVGIVGPVTGQLGDRFGNKALLSVTGFTVPFLPMLYLVSTNLGFLLVVNFFGGVIWAGLALGLQNYVFDSVKPEDRAKAIALYSTVNAVGWSVGALLGSWLVNHLPSHIEWAGVIIHPTSNLPFVFFLSGVLRLIVSSSFLGTFHEARQVERISQQQLLWELPLVKPIAQFVVWALPK